MTQLAIDNVGAPTGNDTKSTTTAAWGLADQEKMRTSGLEVVECLEAVEVRGRLGKRVECKLVDRELVLGVISDKLRLVMPRPSTHPLDKEHADKVVRLSRLVDRDTREAGD